MVDKEDAKKNERVNATVGMTVGGFPARYFGDWEADCRERFAGTYWMKMWNDHQAGQQIGFFQVVLDEINELRKRIESLEAKPAKNELEKPKLIG